jgi:thymidylate synthase
MNNLDKQYQALLQDILDNGVTKQDRTGTGTLSVFGRQIRHKMSEGFPLLTTKKMYFKGIVTELLWFLRGDTNIKYLVDTDCHIWDGDAYKNYFNKTKDLTKDDFEAKGNGVIVIKGFDLKSINQYGNISGTISNSYFIPYTQEEFINKIKTNDEFAKRWGELGPIYGKQWRQWKQFIPYDVTEENCKVAVQVTDQIQNLINDLKTNPDSRRLMVNAWNVGELDQMTLPPCHYGFQIYTRELSWYDDLDKIKEIYVNWSLAKSSGGYAGDIKADTIESANQIFVNGWQNNKDPYTGKPLIELECFSSIPKRAISLMWNQRSVDTFLGLPFNIASYGLLLEIIAKEVNMVPDELIGNLGDTHLYLNHIEQAKEQIGRELSLEERHQLALPIWKEKYGPLADMMVMTNVDNTPYKIPTRTREPFPLPKLFFKYGKETYIDNYELDGFILKDYQSHPTLKAHLSN